LRILIKGYFRLLECALIICLAAMVALVFGNVVLRYGFNTGLDISEELSRYLFLVSTFLGAIVAMRENLHLGVDSVVKRLSLRGKKACFLVSHLLMIYVDWLLLEGSWRQAVINLHVVMPVTGISMAAFYGLGVVFGVSVGGLLIWNVFRLLSGQLDEADMNVVKESEDNTDVAAIESALASGMPAGAKSMQAPPATGARP
jgi:TRAP-type C4-dicarboxylate transport system permease small subunit